MTDKIKEYLKEHFVSRNNYATHYDDTKSAVLASMQQGVIATDGDHYYKLGLTGKEFYDKYSKTPEWEELALIAPNHSLYTDID